MLRIGRLFSVVVRSANRRFVRGANNDRGTADLLRDMGKRAAGGLSAALGTLCGSRAGDRFGVVTYHRVAPRVASVSKPQINVAPRQFRRQIAGVLDRGLTIWPLSKVLDYRADGKPLPPGVTVVTFDDGYESVYLNAYPVLRELQVPATVFVNTAYIDDDDPFPFDSWALAHRDRVPAETYRPLRRRQIDEMAGGGLIEFGSHTHTHDDFRNRPEAFRRDLQTSVEILRTQFGLREVPFAFPYGRWHHGSVSEELMAAAREAGVTCALTTEMELNHSQSDPFGWGRFNADAWDTGRTLAAKLGGWYGWAPKLEERVLQRRRRRRPVRETALPDDVYRGHRLVTRLNAFKRGLVVRAAIPISDLLGRRADDAVGILAYHRVALRTTGASTPTWNVTPGRFRKQMEGLLERGYSAWPLRTLLDYRRFGRPIPQRAFVVTFDDGYENVYRHAWPVLRDLGIPATIFLATGYLDSEDPFPFDDWADAGRQRVPSESWRPLTTRQCRKMIAEGLIDLGSHAHTHADFRGGRDAFRRDLLASLEVLRERFGLTNATFAPPYGFTTPESIATIRQAGLLCNLTVVDRLVGPDDDPYAWGRLSVGQADTAAAIATRLDGWYDLARSAWKRVWRPSECNPSIETAETLPDDQDVMSPAVCVDVSLTTLMEPSVK